MLQYAVYQPVNDSGTNQLHLWKQWRCFLFFFFFDWIKIVLYASFSLNEQWHTEVTLSVQRYLLFYDKPLYP